MANSFIKTFLDLMLVHPTITLDSMGIPTFSLELGGIESNKQKEKSKIDEDLVNAVLQKVEEKYSAVLGAMRKNPSVVEVSETLESVYLKQIAMAQEFLNENSNADLSRVKCLLWKMLPKQYHDVVDKLKQHQDPKVIYNIYGGSNVIAPNANQVDLK